MQGKSSMQIRFQKLTNERHRLTIIRADGTIESADLETKSLLKHDFIHLALETEAQLKNSFWGLVASGKSFLELSQNMKEETMRPASDEEVACTEMVVGALAGAEKQNIDSATFVKNFFAWCKEVSMTYPAWLTLECIDRTRERLRHIQGKWNATPFGDVMEILWEE